MATNDVTTSKHEVSTSENREETRAPDRFLRPAVNIIEDDSGLVLTADLPGAAKQSLTVHVENGVITINAPVSRDLPGRPIYREFEWAPYYRQFQLPDAIDQGKVKAEFRNGVLTLRLPKAEAAKPKRIEVSIAEG